MQRYFTRWLLLLLALWPAIGLSQGAFVTPFTPAQVRDSLTSTSQLPQIPANAILCNYTSSLASPTPCAWNNLTVSYSTLAGNTPGYSFTTNYAPSAAQAAIVYSANNILDFSGTAPPSGGGHIGASLAWTKIETASNGTTIPLTYAGESRIDNFGTATLTSANSNMSMLASNAGTIGSWYGYVSYINSNTGTVSNAYGNQAGIVANSGTIGTFTGYTVIDMSGVPGIGAKYSFRNYDPQAPELFQSVMVDMSQDVESPTSGSTLTIPNNTSTELLNISTVAALTIKMPSAPYNNQEVLVKTVGAITALTMNGNGASFFSTADQPGSMPANGWFRWKYVTNGALWYLVNQGVSGGLPAYTIAGLPTCGSSNLGVAAYVSNGTATPTFMGTVSTTGSSNDPVFCNGTSWVYH